MGKVLNDSAAHRVTLLLLLAGMAFAPPVVHAQDQKGDGVTVDLEVIDGDSGQPVENVVVRIPKLGTYVLTDSLGRTQLVDVEIGSFRLVLTRMGYEAKQREFTIDRSGSFRIALTPVLVRTDAEPGDVMGRVIDPETREGIAGVAITVAGVLHRATDENGWFTVELVPAGAHVIEAEYLGRQTLRDSIFVRDGQTLEVELTLPVEAIELAGITVTAHARFLSRAGFFRRQRAAAAFRGRQWTADDLADRDPYYLQHLLTEVPGIRLTAPGALRGTNVGLIGSRGCRLKVFVDDFAMEDWFDLDGIDPRQVAAMEVYQGDFLPSRYIRECGVILVWLKRR